MTSRPLSCIIIHVVSHRGPAVRQEAGSPAKRGFRKRREHALFHDTTLKFDARKASASRGERMPSFFRTGEIVLDFSLRLWLYLIMNI